MFRHSRHDRGFTLVEILIAIVLVGILSAVVVVGVGSLTSKGSSAACATSLDAARVAVTAHTVSTGTAPTSLAAMVSSGALSLPSSVTIDAGGRRAVSSNWQLVMVAGAAPSFTCLTSTTPLVLDAQPSSGTFLATYSVRRLTAGYAGPAMQVRRSSDSTTADIGFTATGDLDTAALLAFVGSGDGSVVTWYDQSGNGRNATIPSGQTAPKIVIGGALVSRNGVPTLAFDGVSTGLRAAVPGPGGKNLLATAVAQSTVTSSTDLWGRTLSLGVPGVASWQNAGSVTFTRYLGTSTFGVENSDTGYQLTVSAMSPVTNGSMFVYSGEFSATRHRGVMNGAPTADFTPLNAPDTWNFTSLQLGRDHVAGTTNTWLNGNVSEVVISTDSFSSFRQALERDQGTYYGIAVA